MILTIEAANAKDLRLKILELAELFPSYKEEIKGQMPLPVLMPVDTKLEELRGNVPITENQVEEIALKVVNEQGEVEETTEPKKRGRKKKEEVSKPAEEVQIESATEREPVDIKEYTKQDVANAFQLVSTKVNLETARAIASTFINPKLPGNVPCRTISDLSPSDYADCIEACEKACEGL